MIPGYQGSKGYMIPRYQQGFKGYWFWYCNLCVATGVYEQTFTAAEAGYAAHAVYLEETHGYAVESAAWSAL